MRSNRSLRIAHLLIASALLWTLNGCAPDEEAQFEIDYTEDYEADSEEDAAEAEEFAEYDVLDDLADPDDEGGAPVAPDTGLLRQALAPSPGPLSIMQDDPHFSGEMAYERLREAKALGTDIVRVMLWWTGVIPDKDVKRLDRPRFKALNPDRYYEWDRFDTLVRNAHKLKMRVLVTITGPIPYWASREPAYCAAREHQDRQLPEAERRFWGCAWKPDAREYAQFVYAAGRHFSQTWRFENRQIWGWTLWNEPNLGGDTVFLASGDAFAGEGDPRSCLTRRDQSYCRSPYQTAKLYRRLWFTGLRHLRLGACKKFRRAGERRTCERSFAKRVFFGDFSNEVRDKDKKDEVAHFASWSLCLKPQNVSDPKPDLHSYCPEKPRRVYTRGLAAHLYAPSAQAASESLKDMQQFLRGASNVGTAKVLDRLPPNRDVYVTEDGYRTQVGKISLAQQGPVIDQAERLLYKAGARSVAQYELYDDGRGTYDCGLRFSTNAWAPRYQCWMAGQLDPQRCGGPQADMGTCNDACNQLVLAKQGQPKPAFAHYQMPVVATRKGPNEVELFVLARTGQPNSTLIVQGVRPDGTALPIGAGILTVNARGYGEATFPSAGLSAYRITDTFANLVRQVPVP
jgi:hypothetical protein